MTNQLDQTQRGHLIGDMVVSFIFSSLIVTLPILALLLIMEFGFISGAYRLCNQRRTKPGAVGLSAKCQ